jgi:hypothetical protein
MFLLLASALVSNFITINEHDHCTNEILIILNLLTFLDLAESQSRLSFIVLHFSGLLVLLYLFLNLRVLEESSRTLRWLFI